MLVPLLGACSRRGVCLASHGIKVRALGRSSALLQARILDLSDLALSLVAGITVMSC